MGNDNKNFDCFMNEGSIFLGQQTRAVKGRLPSGIYELILVGQQRQLAFNNITTNHDGLVDLPDAAYERVVSELTLFSTPETKKKFKDRGLLHKRSMILYGPPGTGKTCIVNKVAADVVSAGGIVLFNPDVRFLKDAFQQLSSIQPDIQTLVIFEEFDSYVQEFESELLSILDGEIQKDNVIYLATTNYIEEVPPRITRPGRFSSKIEVGMPTDAARQKFLEEKSGLKKKELKEWLKVTEGFTIDELTECIKSVCCLNYTLEDTIERITKLKEEAAKDVRQLHHRSRIRQKTYEEEVGQIKLHMPLEKF